MNCQSHIAPRFHRASLVPCLVTASFLACIIAGAAYALPDSIYVNNTASCPGSGTLGSPYCSIANALNSFAGGSNKVIAVMGTGTPYREEVDISGVDSGSVAAPLVLLARGSVVLQGDNGPSPVFFSGSSQISVNTGVRS